jgi:diguanylate cyclase (GGDEF)-like protein
MLHRISLKKSITLFTILLVIASVSSITTILTLNSHQLIKDNFSREQKQIIRHSQSRLLEFVENQKNDIDAWATQPIVGIYFTVPGLAKLSLPGIKVYFTNIGYSAPWIDSILLIDGDEITSAYSRSSALDSRLLDTDYLLQAPGISIFDMVPKGSSSPEIKLLLKRSFLRGTEGKAEKYLAVLIDPNAIQLKLFQNTEIGSNGFVRLLIKTSDDHIWVPDPAKSDSLDSSAIDQKFQIEARSWSNWSDIGNEESNFQITLQKVFEESIAIIAVVSKQELISPIISQIQISIISGIFILIAGALAAVYLTNKLHKPLLEFVDNINNLEFRKRGLTNFPLQPTAYTEIKSLNKAFRKMFEKLALSNSQLAESEEHARNLFGNSAVAILSEDFSRVVERLDQLRHDGITDLREYLHENEEEAWEMASMVKINSVNNRTLKLYNAKNDLAFTDGIGELIGEDAIEVFCEELIAIWGKADFFRSNATQKTVDGEKIHVIISMPIPDTPEGFMAIPVSIIDITEQKKAEVELERIAHYDMLTDLPNRVLLADRLSQAMVQCQRRNQSLAVAYLDLDGFKTVNDTHGHDVGDKLLNTVSQRMKVALRDGDTLARIGGDEFIAVLIDLDNTEDQNPVLERLLKAAAEPVFVGDIVMQVSVSIGVTLYPQDGVDADQLIRHADHAMYIAKHAGKNQYQLFDTAQDNAIKIQQEDISDIRLALDRSEFLLHYQPKVNMHTGEVIGVEALIRWQHSDRGLVPPLDFLPSIEGNPISLELGEWVIDTALSQISQWQSMRVDIPISVNISGYQLQQTNFTTRLSALLAAHPEVDPNYLELEILETSVLNNISQVSDTMTACHDLGVSFSLDDFGTGYSSLVHLRRLPAYLIKIDQSFVRDMLDDADDLAIIEGVIGLAKTFKHEVIAEGVETIEHGVALLQLGCQLAQGYGIARPMPSDDIPEWVSSWKADDSWQSPGLVERTELDTEPDWVRPGSSRV